MIIKRIVLENFRQYKGKQTIDFSTDSEKNVTVLLGKNTAGKTTLLQAFKWGFYGKTLFDKADVLNKKDLLLNKELELEMDLGETIKVSIKIDLIHTDMQYTIYRNIEYKKSHTGITIGLPELKVSFINEQGECMLIDELKAQNKISEILPEALSDYFFFDTERIGAISNKADVKSSVEGLLGLNVLSTTIEHLSAGEKQSVLGKLRSRLDLNDEVTTREKNKEILDLEEKIKYEKEKLEIKTTEEEEYERLKHDATIELGTLASVKEDQSEKEKLEQQLSQLEETFIENIEKPFKKAHSTAALDIFIQTLIPRAKEILSEAKVDDKGVIDVTSRSINELIKRGTCLCGNCIVEGNEAYNELMKEKSFVPPQSLGTSISNFKKDFNRYEKGASQGIESFTAQYTLLAERQKKIEDLNERIYNLSEKIKGKEDARVYEDNIVKYKAKLKQIHVEKDEITVNINDYDRDLKAAKKEIDDIAKANELNSKTYQYIAYTEAILNKLKSTYSKKETEIRSALESKVNEIFMKMYHGKRNVLIDEKYLVTLKNIDGSITKPSTGLETVKNFAFITGLVSLAKEKILSKEEGINITSEAYPLVMDAPFSNADEEHVRNIANLVPQVAEQVLIFVMEKDWVHAKKVMGDKVGKTYYLNKHSETLTTVDNAGGIN